ncbi:MAG: YlxR family protein [Dehalococcoidia bacterium]|nr:MAG: YlxR family protein [Dehalococcoidia bacterium]
MKTNSAGQLQPLKHIPQRTCVACREVKPKRQLIRLVCTVDGTAEVDPSGKKSGRGAYLCPSSDCWEKGLKKGRLEQALRKRISAENQAALLGFSRTLCSDDKGNNSC